MSWQSPVAERPKNSHSMCEFYTRFILHFHLSSLFGVRAGSRLAASLIPVEPVYGLAHPAIGPLPGEVMVIEGLPNQRLDDRLPADVQLFRRVVEFFQHRRSKIDVHPLYRSHHAALVGKEGRYALSGIGKPRDGFGGDRLLWHVLHG